MNSARPTLAVEDIGEALARRRWERRLTLRQVAAETGVNATTLSRIERGSSPAFGTVAKLAAWLDVVVHAAGPSDPAVTSDEDLKRAIENHLRANKQLPRAVARTIADNMEFALRVEVDRARGKQRK